MGSGLEINGAHIAMRIPLSVRAVGGTIDPVSAHNQVIDECGDVLFGKFGAKISRSTMNLVNRQVDAGLETKIYLIQRNNKNLAAFESKIVTMGHVSSCDSLRFPAYYEDIPGSFFRISDRFERIDVEELFLVRNGKPVVDVVNSTRTPLLLVRRQGDGCALRAIKAYLARCPNEWVTCSEIFAAAGVHPDEVFYAMNTSEGKAVFEYSGNGKNLMFRLKNES